MRRGIATFHYLGYYAALLYCAAVGLMLTVASLRNPSGPMTIRVRRLPPQDLPGATLTDCTLVGDWRG
jgi:hypothetical protein